MSEKSRLSALLFCIYFGVFGGHRFYVGKVGTGIVWLLTFGVLGIGFLVDLITIISGSFYDSNNKPVLAWLRASDSEGNVTRYYT
ncbi:MAG: TM2 domain-containing protein [Candidatus Aminicenantes bacterium]|nr:TM2 domain-containing protein [Candidatus Aminicenantes bacterium]